MLLLLIIFRPIISHIIYYSYNAKIAILLCTAKNKKSV